MTSDPTGPPIIPGSAEPYTPASMMPAPVTKPPRPGWVVPVVAGLVVLVLVLGGVVAWALTRSGIAAAPAEAEPSATPSATNIQVYGHLTLRDVNLDWSTTNARCQGDGGYNDMHQGARVVVTDAAGKTVALDVLGAGSVTRPGRECEFPFSINVPTGLGFYGIAIGSRKAYQVAEVDLSSPVELSLGSD